MSTDIRAQINIKLLSGKIVKININKNDTINDIKNQIQEMEGININQQQIMLNKFLLSKDTKICDIKIESNSIFIVTHKLCE